MGRQTLQDVLEVAIRIVSVELGGLDQAHHGGSALPGAQRPGEEPVVSAERHRTDSVNPWRPFSSSGNGAAV